MARRDPVKRRFGFLASSANTSVVRFALKQSTGRVLGLQLGLRMSLRGSFALPRVLGAVGVFPSRYESMSI